VCAGDGSNAIKVFGQPDCLEAAAAAAAAAAPSGADTPAAAAEGDAGMHNGLSTSSPQEQQDTAATPVAAWERLCSADTAHTADVNCVRWHLTDPTLLASASDDGVIKLWRLHKPKHLTAAAQ
jgi:WD40 repeat protein